MKQSNELKVFSMDEFEDFKPDTPAAPTLSMDEFEDFEADEIASEETNELVELAEDSFKQQLVDNVLNIVPDSIMRMFQGTDFELNVVGSPEDRAKVAKDRAFVADNLGLDVKNIQPTTVMEQVVANVARAGGDPLSFVGGVGRNTVIKGATAATESAVGTATGTVGAEFTSQAFGTEAGSTGDVLARTFGGVMGGVAPTASATGAIKATTAAVPAAFSVVSKTPQNPLDKVSDSVKEGETFVATSQVSEFLTSALKADPNTQVKINEVESILSSYPELKIGPWVAMVENPLLKDNMNYLLKTQPEFRGKVDSQLSEASVALNIRKENLYGKEGSASEKAILDELDKASQKAKKVIEALDKDLHTVTSKASYARVRTPEQIGRTANNLIERKKKAVTSLMSPKYTNLFKNAEDSGVVFSKEKTESLYSFANNEVKELFGVLPREYGQIINKWKPVPVKDSEGKIVKDAQGNVLKESPDGSLRQLDSLKRSINKGLANSNIKGDSRARLENLKKALDVEIRNMGSFGSEYKALDLEYWKLVGLPLGSEGLKQISSKKFDDQKAPLLSKPAQAREFLSSVGDIGLPVVRAAVYSNLNKAAMNPKTSELDYDKVNSFIKSPANRDIIEIAGMSDELSTMTKAIRAIDEGRLAQSNKFIEGSQQYSKDFFAQVNNKGLDEVVTDMFNSRSKTDRYLDFIKGLDSNSQDIILTGIKGEMVSQALNSKGPSIKFFEKNKRAFDSVFGKGTYEEAKKLSKLEDLFNSINLDSVNIASKQVRMQDPIQKRTGVPLSQISSVARDRIMSGFQKFFVILNKMNSSRIDSTHDNLMMDLFLKEGALKNLNEQADKLKLNINKPAAINAFVNSINNSISRGAYMGLQAIEEEQKRQQQNQVQR